MSSKPVKIEGVNNQDRLIVSEQISAMDGDDLESYSMIMAGQMMKAIVAREGLCLALIEHLINTENGSTAARVLSAMGMRSAQIKRKTVDLINGNPMEISEAAKEALLSRIEGSELGLSTTQLKDMLGELPDF